MNDRSYIAAFGSKDSARRVAATESGSRDAIVFFFLGGGASASGAGCEVGAEVGVGSTESEGGGGGGGPISESESDSTCGGEERRGSKEGDPSITLDYIGLHWIGSAHSLFSFLSLDFNVLTSLLLFLSSSPWAAAGRALSSIAPFLFVVNSPSRREEKGRINGWHGKTGALV